MKQTAVEWLISNLQQSKDWQRVLNEVSQMSTVQFNLLEQAKGMEKQQIKDAWINSLTKGDYNSADEYYNETFKSENIVMFMTPENGEIESIILTDNPFCGVKGITFKSE